MRDRDAAEARVWMPWQVRALGVLPAEQPALAEAIAARCLRRGAGETAVRAAADGLAGVMGAAEPTGAADWAGSVPSTANAASAPSVTAPAPPRSTARRETAESVTKPTITACAAFAICYTPWSEEFLCAAGSNLECQTHWVTSNSSANGLDFGTNLCSNENVFE